MSCDTKICTSCSIEKPRNEFPKRGGKCKKCKSKQRSDYYKQNKQRVLEINDQYRRDNWESVKTYRRDRLREIRLEVLRAYGGDNPKCDCCGESIIEFLSIDHIDGGGRQHRQQIKKSIYIWLKQNDFPDGYRVLCHNCNMAHDLYGYCPHVQCDL